MEYIAYKICRFCNYNCGNGFWSTESDQGWMIFWRILPIIIARNKVSKT